jgi:hypothetical protein
MPLPVGCEAGSVARGARCQTIAERRPACVGRGSGFNLTWSLSWARRQPDLCGGVTIHSDPACADPLRRLAELNRPLNRASPSVGVSLRDGVARAVAFPRSHVVTWSDRFNCPTTRILPMNSLILLAALALVPFVPATDSSRNVGCGKCDCCGCCETARCECTSCTCVCCVEECQSSVLKAEQSICCGSGCCSK